MTLKWRGRGNNHFHFMMFMPTECFSPPPWTPQPPRRKHINLHSSLRYSSTYLFSQKNHQKLLSQIMTVRKLKENSRFKNRRLILNDFSFSRIWGSLLFTIFFSLLLCTSMWDTSILLSIESFCLQIALIVSSHYCTVITKASFDVSFSHSISVNFETVKHHVPI